MILQIIMTTQLPIPVLLAFLVSFLDYKSFNWLCNNHMKTIPGKCHLLPST